MTDKYVDLLRKSKKDWNDWRRNNYPERANFSHVNLDGMDLSEYNLSNCNFNHASLRECNFNQAEITWSAFMYTDFSGSTFLNPTLATWTENKRLMGVNLRWSSFGSCNLQRVRMNDALMEAVHMHHCDLRGADLSNAEVNGISAWGNIFDETTIQQNLIITAADEAEVTVDDIELAQFVYLLINNEKIRSAIDTVTSKVILILGSFAPRDKAVLDQIKKKLGFRGYIAVMFDFDKPNARSLTETVSTLAHLSKFIITDLSNQRSVPHELATLIPTLLSVPVVPLIQAGEAPYGMFADIQRYPQVRSLIRYTPDAISDQLVEEIIDAAINGN